MGKQWFVRLRGKEHGPISSSRLKQLADAGKVLPDTEVRLGANGPWGPARRVKGLFHGLDDENLTAAKPAAKPTAGPLGQAPTSSEPNGRDEASDVYEVVQDSGTLPANHQEAAAAKTDAPVCPSCGGSISPNAVLCVLCGYSLRTGERLQTETINETPPGRTEESIDKDEKKTRINDQLKKRRISFGIAVTLYGGVVAYFGVFTTAKVPLLNAEIGSWYAMPGFGDGLGVLLGLGAVIGGLLVICRGKYADLAICVWVLVAISMSPPIILVFGLVLLPLELLDVDVAVFHWDKLFWLVLKMAVFSVLIPAGILYGLAMSKLVEAATDGKKSVVDMLFRVRQV